MYGLAAMAKTGFHLAIGSCIGFLFFKILFIFRERGREGDREGEKHQCVVASCCYRVLSGGAPVKEAYWLLC